MRLEDIMSKLDQWVSLHGNGQYIAATSEPALDYGINEEWGIQQARSEIKDFVSTLIDRKLTGKILEVGLGYYGSTHYLWRQLFTSVTTIEKSHDRIRTFGENTRTVCGKWVLNDGQSAFLIGYSHDPVIIKKTYEAINGQVDVLFIDGDHRYESVLADWLIYSPTVRKGGVVAFHDTLISRPDSYYGVPQLMRELTEGKLDGKPRTLQNIFHSTNLGISFYEQQ